MLINTKIHKSFQPATHEVLLIINC